MTEALNLFVGVDPGSSSGAIAALRYNGDIHGVILIDSPEQDICDTFAEWAPHVVFALYENVAARPGQGVSSTFKFGASFGECKRLLACHRIRRERIQPAKWQEIMKCRTGGDKNISKAAAQSLWPGFKVIHHNADALLIAEVARRMAIQRRYVLSGPAKVPEGQRGSISFATTAAPAKTPSRRTR